ncbi:UNVERIFIED_CONTAM: hypothetical protein Slati_3483100 [Sesamum latifolium]|uniref:Reverse transcriptase domain-containing protein n=1 Tax=Sesamum latifolium TaxID=2727402 RepID=A0AAW2UIL6_9LAMI
MLCGIEGQEWWLGVAMAEIDRGVYGEPDTDKRVGFWNLLRRLHSQSARPWLCAGDYNELLAQSEKDGGPLRAEWQIRNFWECLSDCELHDLGFQGPAFTWCSNQQAPHTVHERLDRACANTAWSQTFREACIRHLESPYSDHSPLLIELHPVVQINLSGSRKCFRFEAAWLQEPTCETIISTTWSTLGSGLREKLACVGSNFSCWGRVLGREVRDRIQELERSLVARKWDAVTAESQARALREKAELSKLLLQEEISWKQRSKDLWLKKVEYFQAVFTSSNPLPDDIQSGMEHLPTVVDSAMAEDLLRPYTESEVTKALFSMSPLKSPGPDGMPPLFYQKFWHIVKSDVISSVLEFLNCRILPDGFNDTHIVLIPKCKQPQSLSHYHPISLCNVVYKVASKAIANRLKPWLDRIISPAQSAFVPGRLITDNVLLAFETNHFLNIHSKGKSLSSLFRVAEELGTIPGVAVRRVLDVYKLASGQEINLHKPSAAFSRNTSIETRQQLAGILGVHLENKHEVYLGLPAVAFRSKRALFSALKDRIWKRIQGWQEKLLSQAGKAVLIQAVVQAIPSYAMSCFRLPKSLLQEFQSLAANFFGHDGERRRIHWLAWSRLCSSKLDGGLGFRDLEAFNLALLTKQLWRLLSRLDNLVCKVLKAKYFPRSHLFEARLGTRPSFTWRSIMAAMELFRSGCHWREWNIRVISSLFWPEDKDLILQLPLSWGAHILSLGSRASSSVGRWDSRLWRVLWQANIPNKVKIFMWRAICNILPTASNLAKRMPLASVGCPLCALVDETPIHSLLYCSFARQVWALSGIQWSVIDSHIMSVEDWFFGLVEKVASSDLHLVVMISWTIWWSRNLKLAHKDFLLPLQVVDFARGRALGLGVVVRDATGSCLAWLSIRLNGGGSPELAEALAAREAIRLAWRFKWRQVVLEGDCSTVLQKLSHAVPDFSVSSLVLEDIRYFCSLVDSVVFSFVLRSGNLAADFLAKRALNQEGDSTFLPPGLDSVVWVIYN